jgi:CheY-like chemotaxis protein
MATDAKAISASAQPSANAHGEAIAADMSAIAFDAKAVATDVKAMVTDAKAMATDAKAISASAQPSANAYEEAIAAGASDVAFDAKAVATKAQVSDIAGSDPAPGSSAAPGSGPGSSPALGPAPAPGSGPGISGSGADGIGKDGDGCFLGYRVLLAEDVEVNREIVMAFLERTMLAIDCAENGAMALEMFQSAPKIYDLIFMDISMPVMDGYEAVRRIRALGGDYAKNIPIIAMTASVFREDIEKCIAAGMDDHVGKPLNIGDIIGKLRKYLKKSRAAEHSVQA